MNWLDEIKAVYSDYTWKCKEEIRKDAIRMTRVLKELAEYIKLEDSLPMMYENSKAALQSWQGRSKLSKDAKELLK